MCLNTADTARTLINRESISRNRHEFCIRPLILTRTFVFVLVFRKRNVCRLSSEKLLNSNKELSITITLYLLRIAHSILNGECRFGRVYNWRQVKFWFVTEGHSTLAQAQGTNCHLNQCVLLDIMLRYYVFLDYI